MGIPSSFSLTYSQDVIARQVITIGSSVGIWAKKAQEHSGKQVLAVCVLRGGVFFFADLLRAIPTTIEPAFCRTWSYSSEDNAQHANVVKTRVDGVACEGRHLLLVDDICDTGATLKKLEEEFLELGASEVKSTVLIHRATPWPHFTPDWSAFEYAGKEWFVGYGMEDKNSYSNLPDIYTLPLK